MTQDNGMDCQPSWQELKAAHDKALVAAKYWQSRAEKAEKWNQDMVAKAAEDSDLAGYRKLCKMASKAEAERDSLKAHVERINAEYEVGAPLGRLERIGAALNESPATSLARLKAEWQAEALEKAANYLQHGEGKDSVNPPVSLRGLAIRLRSKIEENDHDER